MAGAAADAGRALRKAVPRVSHAAWEPDRERAPLAVLEATNWRRVPELVAIRIERIRASPFAFLRGAPAVMAADLAATPVTGISVQACGDAHLLNFGLFATPERNLVFGLNDFDETHYVRQLWDMKGSVQLEDMTGGDLVDYARLCGWVLARAHARSGDGAAISGYLGGRDRFDGAVADFAEAYADQTLADYAAFLKAGERPATPGPGSGGGPDH